MRKKREYEIEDFCKDLGLMWNKYCKYSSFVDIMKGIDFKNYTSDAEMIDVIRERCEELRR